MDESLTVTKAALFNLLDEVLREFEAVLLNPQPLPPNAARSRDPWRSATVARTVIDQAVAQYRFAEELGGNEQADRTIEALRSVIGEFVEDYCGTAGPSGWPLPWPHPLVLDTPERDPLDLLVAGAQFHKAADLVGDGPLRRHFSAAAGKLLKTGMGRLEGG